MCGRCSAGRGGHHHGEDGVGKEGESDDRRRHGDASGRELTHVQRNSDANHRGHRGRNSQVCTAINY